jgi:hypothetical protein
LVSLTDLPHSFGYARKIYELQSRPENLSQAASLPEALEVWRY